MSVDRLSNEDIIEQVLAARRESLDSRLTKDAWARKAWNSYNNLHDWSAKEDWQSKMAIPKFAMAVDQATNFMRSSLRKSSRLFGIEVLNDDPVDKLLAAFFGAVMHETVRTMRIQQTFVDGLKVALITNQAVHKIGYESVTQTEIAPALEESQVEVRDSKGNIVSTHTESKFVTREVLTTTARPTATLVDPIRYYPDPRGVGLYEVHDAFKDLFWVLEKFEGIAPKKLLDALVNDKSGSRSGEEKQDIDQRNRAEIFDPSNEFRREVKLTDYWGPLFDREGKLVAKRVRVVLANDKHILVRGDPYPYWDGESPFVKYQGLTVPFSVWGKLLIQHTDSLSTYVNELASLMMDKAKLSALSPLAIDVSLIDDMEDIMSGMFPGKVFRTRGPSAVEEIGLKGVGADHFQMQGFMGQELQNAHGVTEFLQGLPTSRGRATATEVEEKMTQGAEFFNGILQQSNEGMEKIFEKIYFRTMQFKDDWASEPAIAKIAERFGMTPILEKLNPVERYNLMKRPFRFHAAGLNAAIRRSEMLKNLTDMLSVLGNFGEEAINSLPLDKIFNQIIEAFDMTELLNTPSAQPNVIVPGPAEGLQNNAPQLQNGKLPPNLQQGVEKRVKGGK